MLVLVGHFTALPVGNWGTLGVGFFFALSGRLMGEILFEQRFPAGSFLLRRFSRVWPVLLVFVMLTMLLSRATSFWGAPLTPAAALSALTFSYGYARLWEIGGEQIKHIWSLCIEEHSYLVLLLVAGLTARNIKKATWVLGLIAIASIADGLYRSIALGGNYYQVYWLTDAMLHVIPLSVLTYLWRAKLTSIAGRAAAYASPALMITAALLSYHHIPAYVSQTLTPIVLAIAVAMLPEAKRQIIAALEWRPLTLIGAWSYSIYIWQQPFYDLGLKQSFSERIALMLLAITLGASSFYTVEQHAREWLNRRFASRRVATSPAPCVQCDVVNKAA